LDAHELRNTIRDCWDRSDNGHSFQAALEHEGMTLAQGERRDFVVIDQRGGTHVLSKRILDVTAAKIRDRLSDISRDELPSVEMTRAFLSERTTNEAKQQEKAAPAWDRDRDDRAWQDAVINAAIEKEKAERQFVEPKERKADEKQRRAGAGGREKEWSVIPPTPEPIRTSPEHHFADAAREAIQDRNYSPPKDLKGMSARIMNYVQTLWNDPEKIAAKGKTLTAILDHEGIALAEVKKEEADRSHREAQFAKAAGNYAPRFKEGEIVAITEPTLEYRRNGEVMGPAPRVHKLDPKAAEIFIAELDKPRLVQGIDATKQALNERAALRAAGRDATRLENATNIIDRSRIIAIDKIKRTAKVGKAATRAIGKTLDAVSNAFESLFAPTLTPEQIRQGERSALRREAEAESSIDFARYTGELAQQRRQQENDREAERQRHRDGGGRER
jgi:hypothetical protein